MPESTGTVVPPGIYQRWIAVAALILDGPIQIALSDALGTLYSDDQVPPTPEKIEAGVSSVLKAMRTWGFDSTDLEQSMKAAIGAFMKAPPKIANPVQQYAALRNMFSGLNSPPYGTPEHRGKRAQILFKMAAQAEASGLLATQIAHGAD